MPTISAAAICAVQEWVFAEGGVIAAEQRVADDVDVRREQDVLLQRLRLAAQYHAVEAGGLGVEGGGQPDGRGHAGRIPC